MFRKMADEYLTAALYGINRFNEWASKKVKELMGVDKLIELLNEYETPQSGIVFKSYDDYDGTFYGVDCDGETEVALSDSFICGKRYQWVKWLVENDKIDQHKFYDKNILKGFVTLTKEEKADSIIMNLSISDTPIDFLCEILM